MKTGLLAGLFGRSCCMPVLSTVARKSLLSKFDLGVQHHRMLEKVTKRCVNTTTTWMFAESKTQETDCTVENQDKFDKVIPELKKRLGFAYVSQPSTASSASKSLSAPMKSPMNCLSDTELLKKFQLAVSFHKQGSLTSLKQMMELINGFSEVSNKVPPRIVYLAMDLALRLEQLDDADVLMKLMPKKVHILATSLRIRYYCAKQQLDEALSEMTEVLNNESTGFDVQSKVSNSALDQLCETIKSTSNSIEQMRLFRRLQRILTKYSLRSPTDFVSLLYSDILIRQEQVDFARDDIKIDEETTKKILEISPYILCDN